MATYMLEVSSWTGARHYKGRVTGEYPQSCHGSTHFNAPEHRGKTTCDEGHELPGQVEFEVEASWPQERYERYAARHFEGDGPSQFADEDSVLRTAAQRFLGQLPAGRWWEEAVPQFQPGDKLFYGHPARTAAEIDDDGYGGILAEIPVDRGQCAACAGGPRVPASPEHAS